MQSSRKRNLLLRHAAVMHRRASRLPASVRSLLWSILAGVLFVLLNAVMRGLAQALNPSLTQFLRYLAGIVLLLPFMASAGFATFRTRERPVDRVVRKAAPCTPYRDWGWCGARRGGALIVTRRVTAA